MAIKKLNVLLLILLLVLAFFGGYLLVKNGVGLGSGNITESVLDKFDGQDTQPEATPDTSNTPILLTQKRVISITNSYKSKSVFYFEKNTGKLFELNFDEGQETPISEKIVPNFLSAIWSPTKKEVVQVLYSQSGNKFRYANIQTGEGSDLGPDVRSVAFSGDGSFIGLFRVNPEASSSLGEIAISQPNGSYQKSIFKTRIDNLALSWPLRDRMAIMTPDSGLYTLKETGEFEKIMGSEPGFESIWSKSGEKILFSSFNEASPDFNYQLFLKNIETMEEYSLDVEVQASKCTWSIDDINVFCAVAKNPSTDEVYKINTKDKSKKLIAEPGFKVNEMIVSNLEDLLLLTNIADDKLYSIKISD